MTDPLRCDRQRAVRAGHRSCGFELGAREIDAATRVTEISTAGSAVEPSALLVEAVHRTPKLGHEGAVGAPDLTDETGVEERPLRRLRPVDEPGLDPG
ncbi:MAG: hypothetical protein M3158_06425, partial [Pseudomonadota bacterium]|nr:hypothetical protein [Pseudomonadota bacterium]